MKTSYMSSFFKRAWLVVTIIMCLCYSQLIMATNNQKTEDDGYIKTLIV
jgi:hypothetical protein